MNISSVNGLKTFLAQTELDCLPLVCKLHCTYYLLNIHFMMAKNWDWKLDMQKLNNGFNLQYFQAILRHS